MGVSFDHQKKRADFILFKQALDLIRSKEHLTTSGLEKIVNIRASMNLDLPGSLKASYPLSFYYYIYNNKSNVVPVDRSIVDDLEIPEPACGSMWVYGS